MIRLQQSGKALGSDISLTLVTRQEKAAQIFQPLWAQINSFEERFSRFKPDSELSQLNAQAGQIIMISAEMQGLLDTSIQLSEHTKGLFNPLVLPALQQAGYVGSWPEPQNFDKQLAYTERRIANINEIKLTKSAVKLPPDVALDFGGIGKGYLLDQLARYLDTLPVKGYWLSLGGDIICSGYDHEKQPWRIGLASATKADEQAGFVINKTGEHMAVATSGTTKRKGPGWHHIIDPRTGQPAETQVLTASVVASRATVADVLAKCLVIVGASGAHELATANNTTAYLLQIGQNETKVIKSGDIS